MENTNLAENIVLTGRSPLITTDKVAALAEVEITLHVSSTSYISHIVRDIAVGYSAQ